MPTIAAQLTAFRESLGLTVESAAATSGVPAPRFRALEHDGQPTTSELWRIAHALGVSPASLLAATDAPSSRTTARFRAPDGATGWSASDAQMLAQASEVSRVGAWLSGVLGHAPSALSKFRRVTALDMTKSNWVEGYELGELRRSQIRPSARPIESVEGLLDELGVHVARVRFETNDVLAASIVDANGIPTILLNVAAIRVSSPLSRRAVLAHELCHLLHDGGEAELAMVSELHDADRLPTERRANGFAPAFLVPRTWLSAFEEPGAAYVRDVAETWGLTYEGAVWHVKNAFAFREEWARNLLKTPESIAPTLAFESAPARLPIADIGPNLSVSPLVSGRIADLVVEAAKVEAISLGRAREILAWR